MFLHNDGADFARTGRVGQAHIKSDCALAQTALYCTSGRREDMEKRATKMIKSNDALFGVSEAAEQTKNFLSFNFSALRRGVRGEPQKNGRKFLVLIRRFSLRKEQYLYFSTFGCSFLRLRGETRRFHIYNLNVFSALF